MNPSGAARPDAMRSVGVVRLTTLERLVLVDDAPLLGAKRCSASLTRHRSPRTDLTYLWLLGISSSDHSLTRPQSDHTLSSSLLNSY